MSFVVAYFVPHNEGVEQGIIDGPGFDTELSLIDLYEVDARIRSFTQRADAQAWLDAKTREHDYGPSAEPAVIDPQPEVTAVESPEWQWREWVHEQPDLSKCGVWADTCPDWPLAHRLAEQAAKIAAREGR